MSRLTRDGTAETVSRDQILRHARGQGNINFPVQLTTSRIGNLTRLIHTLLYVMTIHTYIHTHPAQCNAAHPARGPSYLTIIGNLSGPLSSYAFPIAMQVHQQPTARRRMKELSCFSYEQKVRILEEKTNSSPTTGTLTAPWK